MLFLVIPLLLHIPLQLQLLQLQRLNEPHYLTPVWSCSNNLAYRVLTGTAVSTDDVQMFVPLSSPLLCWNICFWSPADNPKDGSLDPADAPALIQWLNLGAGPRLDEGSSSQFLSLFSEILIWLEPVTDIPHLAPSDQRCLICWTANPFLFSFFYI